MAEEICPTCGCTVDKDRFEKEGVAYCCAPCANGEKCTCDDCEEIVEA